MLIAIIIIQSYRTSAARQKQCLMVKLNRNKADELGWVYVHVVTSVHGGCAHVVTGLHQ